MELAESDELTEFTADELSAVIRDDGGSSIGKRLSCLLDDDLGVSGPHGGKEFPGHGIAAVSVDNAAHVVEGTRDLDVSEVDVPVLVGFGRLLETIASPGVGWRWPGQQTFLFEHSVDSGRAYCHDIFIHHHKGQSAVADSRVFSGVVDNSPAFLGSDP
ncbi:MAG: hypothetical protein KatS3mg110_4428 [Pirellulaceae bacterium]|nr:MAG: hypothetical protein KatS3mg110_4428 [Pirellulaceae bacterium]